MASFIFSPASVTELRRPTARSSSAPPAPARAATGSPSGQRLYLSRPKGIPPLPSDLRYEARLPSARVVDAFNHEYLGVRRGAPSYPAHQVANSLLHVRPFLTLEDEHRLQSAVLSSQGGKAASEGWDFVVAGLRGDLLYVASGALNAEEVLARMAERRKMELDALTQVLRPAVAVSARWEALREDASALGVTLQQLGAFLFRHWFAGTASADQGFPGLDPLDRFHGQAAVKQMARELAAVVYTNDAWRHSLGIPEHTPNGHFALVGPPGAGKTTMARALAESYQNVGLLQAELSESDSAPGASSSKPSAASPTPDAPPPLPTGLRMEPASIEASRASLVGRYIGQSAQQTDAVAKEAARTGRVLIVDEAHELNPGDDNPRDFGPEAWNAVLKRAEDDKGRLLVGLTGYAGKMEELLDRNPGARRRFPRIIELTEPTLNDLEGVLTSVLKEKGLRISPHTRRAVLQALETRRVGKGFGGAGEVVNFVDQAIGRQRLRHYQKMLGGWGLDPGLARFLKTEDFLLHSPEQKFEEDPFADTIGLEAVKQKVDDFAFALRRAQARGADQMWKHMDSVFLFLGEPGTGKTTSARALARKAYLEGALPTDEVVVLTPASFNRPGKTIARAVEEALEQCRGKTVLFDEAYALPQEAIDAFVAQSESPDVKGKMLIAFAGYPRQMREFVQRNRGLFSRIPTQLEFASFTPENAVEKARQIVRKEQGAIVLDAEADAALPSVMTRIRALPAWSSARDVENFMNKAIVFADARMVRSGLSEEKVTTVTLADLQAAEAELASSKTGLSSADSTRS